MPLQFADLTYQLEVFGVVLLFLVVFLAGLVTMGYIAFLFGNTAIVRSVVSNMSSCR